MLVFGCFTRLAALGVVIFMINAVWFTSAKGFFWTAGGSEFSLLLLAVALVFLVKGSGEYSIDKKSAGTLSRSQERSASGFWTRGSTRVPE